MGKTSRGKRDSTGPHKNSLQRTNSGNIGKRQQSGRKCPKKWRMCNVADVTNKNITENFAYKNLTCPCCDRIKINDRTYRHMELLQEMRTKLNFPIYVNSGYRCKQHNIDVGGSVKSQHMEFATDIRPSYQDGFKQRLKAIYDMAEKLGFDGIGRYESFIHVDLRGSKARWNS